MIGNCDSRRRSSPAVIFDDAGEMGGPHRSGVADARAAFPDEKERLP